MEFLLFFFIPILIPIFVFVVSHRKISVKELLYHFVIQAIVAGVSVAICFSANTLDVEIWNGFVTKKEREKVSCDHSYDCRCHEVCSDGSCTTECDTCYEHDWDVDWAYYTTDNGRSVISRLDDQGLIKPQRWEEIEVGEPSASRHIYTNYIKASDSLFKKQGQSEMYKDILKAIEYPSNIYDYYKIDRIIPLGLSLPKKEAMEEELSKINSILGHKKQVNMIVVIVNSVAPDFFYALEEHWFGGKKNDVILVLGVDVKGVTQATIQWVNVMAWTDQEQFKIELRDRVLALSVLDLLLPSQITSIMADTVFQFYERKPMADFAYLREAIQPSTTQLIILLLVGVFLSVGLSYWFYKEDI